jgi:hypothetical protein
MQTDQLDKILKLDSLVLDKEPGELPLTGKLEKAFT